MLSSSTQRLIVRRLGARQRRLRLLPQQSANETSVIPHRTSVGPSSFSSNTYNNGPRAFASSTALTNPTTTTTLLSNKSNDNNENKNANSIHRLQTDFIHGQFLSFPTSFQFRSFATRATSSSSSNHKNTASSSSNNNKKNNKNSDHERKLSSVVSHNHDDAKIVEDDEDHPTYRERATQYRDQAREGAKSFGGLMKQYGPVFFGTYLSVYVATLSALFSGIQSGAIDPAYVLGWISGNPDDIRSTATIVAEMLEKYPWTEQYAPIVHEKPHYAVS